MRNRDKGRRPGVSRGPKPKEGAEGTLRGPSISGKMLHPLVGMLEGAADRALPVWKSSNEKTRFKQIIRSLAIPVAFLMDSHNLTELQKKKCLVNFADSIKFLSTLSSSADTDLDFIKYQVNVWFQKGVGDLGPHAAETRHLPVQPSEALRLATGGRNLFSGEIAYLIRRAVAKAQHKSAHARSILASFLLSKRGWPELGKMKYFESVHDHQVYLSREPPPIPSALADRIRDAVRRVITSERSFTYISPSHHASYQHSRKEGGAYSEVVQFPPQVPQTVWDQVRKTTGPQPFRFGLLPELSQAAADFKLKVFNHVSSKVLRRDFAGEPAVGSDLLRSPQERFHCRLQVIPEPGKFRIITAMEADLSTFLQPLQKKLLRDWAHSPFSTMTATWKKDLESLPPLPEGWVWNSVDYKAATDQLNILSTNIALNEILRLLQIDIPTGMAPGATTIHYPEKSLDRAAYPDEKSEIRQTTGQLMGHPLSFPLLCIINLAALLATFGKSKDLDFILHATRINGDDALFPSPAFSVPKFEANAASLGLKMSLGKTYSSPSFAMINNVMYNVTAAGLREFSYLNQKLILNHSLKTGEAEKTPMEIGHAFNKMFELCKGSHRFLPDCVRSRSKGIPIGGFIPNFFFPCTLGGFGVDQKWSTSKLTGYQVTVPPAPIHSTRQQRIVAALFAEDQISAYLVSQGKNPKSKMAPILKLFPSARRAEHFGPLTETDSQTGLSQWVGLLSSWDPALEKPPRFFNWKKNTGKLQPMKLANILAYSVRFVLPDIPPPVIPFTALYPPSPLHYTRRGSRRITRESLLQFPQPNPAWAHQIATLDVIHRLESELKLTKTPNSSTPQQLTQRLLDFLSLDGHVTEWWDDFD